MRTFLALLATVLLLSSFTSPVQAQYTANIDWTAQWYLDAVNETQLDYLTATDLKHNGGNTSSGGTTGTHTEDFDHTLTDGTYYVTTELDSSVTINPDNGTNKLEQTSRSYVRGITNANGSNDPKAICDARSWATTRTYLDATDDVYYLDVEVQFNYVDLSNDPNTDSDYQSLFHAAAVDKNSNDVLWIEFQYNLDGSITLYQTYTTNSGTTTTTTNYSSLSAITFPLTITINNLKMAIDTSGKAGLFTTTGEEGRHTLYMESPDGTDLSADEYHLNTVWIKVNEITTTP